MTELTVEMLLEQARQLRTIAPKPLYIIVWHAIPKMMKVESDTKIWFAMTQGDFAKLEYEIVRLEAQTMPGMGFFRSGAHVYFLDGASEAERAAMWPVVREMLECIADKLRASDHGGL